VHVADEAPGAHLELGTLAGSHLYPLIAEEGGAPGNNPGPRRDPKLDVAQQMEDAKRGFVGRRSAAQIHPYVTEEGHDLLIRPSGGKHALGHIAEERERWRLRRGS
jgi:hypothetical protein